VAGDLAASRHNKAMLEAVRAIDPASLSEVWQVRRDVVADMLEKRLVSDRFGVVDVGSP
jgi:uncharacterized protein (DUF885 family)